jgi:hypothetical protein
LAGTAQGANFRGWGANCLGSCRLGLAPWALGQRSQRLVLDGKGGWCGGRGLAGGGGGQWLVNEEHPGRGLRGHCGAGDQGGPSAAPGPGPSKGEEVGGMRLSHSCHALWEGRGRPGSILRENCTLAMLPPVLGGLEKVNSNKSRHPW